jgi:hypothetical protein
VNEVRNKFDTLDWRGIQSNKYYTLVTKSNKRLMTLNRVNLHSENDLLLFRS